MSEKVTAGRDYLGGFAPEHKSAAILYIENVPMVHIASAS